MTVLAEIAVEVDPRSLQLKLSFKLASGAVAHDRTPCKGHANPQNQSTAHLQHPFERRKVVL